MTHLNGAIGNYTKGNLRPLKITLKLQFFASADSEGRTENATDKKKEDARKEGQVAKSPEIATAFSMLIFFWGMKVFGKIMYRNLEEVFYFSIMLIRDFDQQFSVTRMTGLVVYMAGRIAIVVAPVFALACIVGLATSLVQVGWHPTTKPLKPKFKNLNPVSGFKKLLSVKSLLEIPKSLLKLGLIGYIVYKELKSEYTHILMLLDMGLEQGLAYLAGICIRLGIKVGAWYLIIAAADYAYVRYKHKSDLKMTKQQVKDEYKNSEGDPHIKGQIKQKMREISMRRMMSDVPHADVIITNPTHYAVALKYDKQKAASPFVVAKGVDFMAERIKKIGRENNIHIVENRHLARSLYSAVDVNQEIPEELFQAVAEILAYVYSIKNPA